MMELMQTTKPHRTLRQLYQLGRLQEQGSWQALYWGALLQ
jgi:hypothetical protein